MNPELTEPPPVLFLLVFVFNYAAMVNTAAFMRMSAIRSGISIGDRQRAMWTMESLPQLLYKLPYEDQIDYLDLVFFLQSGYFVEQPPQQPAARSRAGRSMRNARYWTERAFKCLDGSFLTAEKSHNIWLNLNACVCYKKHNAESYKIVKSMEQKAFDRYKHFPKRFNEVLQCALNGESVANLEIIAMRPPISMVPSPRERHTTVFPRTILKRQQASSNLIADLPLEMRFFLDTDPSPYHSDLPYITDLVQQSKETGKKKFKVNTEEYRISKLVQKQKNIAEWVKEENLRETYANVSRALDKGSSPKRHSREQISSAYSKILLQQSQKIEQVENKTRDKVKAMMRSLDRHMKHDLQTQGLARGLASFAPDAFQFQALLAVDLHDLVMDLMNTVVSVSKSSDGWGVASAFTMLVRKWVGVNILNYTSALAGALNRLNDVVSEPIQQFGFSQVRDTVLGLAAIKSSAIVAAVNDFMMALSTSASFLPDPILKFVQGYCEILNVFGSKNSLWDRFTSMVQLIFDKGWKAYATGNWGVFFDSKEEFMQLHEETMLIQGEYNSLVSMSEKGDVIDAFAAKVEILWNRLRRFIKSCGERTLNFLIADWKYLTALRIDIQHAQTLVQRQATPLALFFIGKPGIGKTSLMYYSHAIIAGALKLPRGVGYIYNIQTGHNFDDGATGVQWHAVIDDVAIDLPDAKNAEEPQRMIRIINSVKCNTHQAEIEKKGKIAFNFKLVTATGNKLGCNFEKVITTPAAVHRRFVTFEVSLHPQFKNAGGFLSVPVGETESWFWTLTEKIYNPVAPSKWDTGMVIDNEKDFVTWLSDHAVRHFAKESNALRATEETMNAEWCSVGHKKTFGVCEECALGLDPPLIPQALENITEFVPFQTLYNPLIMGIGDPYRYLGWVLCCMAVANCNVAVLFFLWLRIYRWMGDRRRRQVNIIGAFCNLFVTLHVQYYYLSHTRVLIGLLDGSVPDPMPREPLDLRGVIGVLLASLVYLYSIRQIVFSDPFRLFSSCWFLLWDQGPRQQAYEYALPLALFSIFPFVYFRAGVYAIFDDFLFLVRPAWTSFWSKIWRRCLARMQPFLEWCRGVIYHVGLTLAQGFLDEVEERSSDIGDKLARTFVRGISLPLINTAEEVSMELDRVVDGFRASVANLPERVRQRLEENRKLLVTSSALVLGAYAMSHSKPKQQSTEPIEIAADPEPHKTQYFNLKRVDEIPLARSVGNHAELIELVGKALKKVELRYPNGKYLLGHALCVGGQFLIMPKHYLRYEGCFDIRLLKSVRGCGPVVEKWYPITRFVSHPDQDLFMFSWDALSTFRDMRKHFTSTVRPFANAAGVYIYFNDGEHSPVTHQVNYASTIIADAGMKFEGATVKDENWTFPGFEGLCGAAALAQHDGISIYGIHTHVDGKALSHGVCTRVTKEALQRLWDELESSRVVPNIPCA